MKRQILLYISLVTLLFSSFPLWSQTGDTEKILIYSYVESEDPVLQDKAITTMRTRWKKQGNLDEDLEKLLIAMAASSIRQEVFEDGKLIRTNKDIQQKSIAFLGEIGGQKALDTMTELLDKCREYSILYETVNSSAHIKADDYSSFLASLAKAMKNQHYTELDNAFAYESLFTLNSLMDSYDVLPTPEIVKIVLLYSESAYIQKVRDFARQILAKY